VPQEDLSLSDNLIIAFGFQLQIRIEHNRLHLRAKPTYSETQRSRETFIKIG
jgi:hypothetical protein